MEHDKSQAMDYLDLLITVLQEHEKTLDSLINELTIIASNLKAILDRLDARNGTMKRFHEPIKM